MTFRSTSNLSNILTHFNRDMLRMISKAQKCTYFSVWVVNQSFFSNWLSKTTSKWSTLYPIYPTENFDLRELLLAHVQIHLTYDMISI